MADPTQPRPGPEPGGEPGSATDGGAGAPLPDWLQRPELGPLWRAARDRLARAGRHAGGTVSVRGLDRAGRGALAELTGREAAAAEVRVDLAALDAELRRRAGLTLRQVVEQRVGPLTPPGADAAPREAAAAAGGPPSRCPRAQAWLDERLALGVRPWCESGTDRWLPGWLDAAGRDHDTGEDELVTALGVLELLLGTPEPPLRVRSTLATEVALDPHALDDDRPLARWVLRGLAGAESVAAGEPSVVAGAPAGDRLPGDAAGLDAAGRDALWDRFGVVPQPLGSPCLTLGLTPLPALVEGATGPVVDLTEAADRWLLAARDAAPVYVTGWDLARHPGPWGPAADLADRPGTPPPGPAPEPLPEPLAEVGPEAGPDPGSAAGPAADLPAVVLLCDDPAAVAELARTAAGTRGVPPAAICPGPRPDAVARELLRRVRAAGAVLRPHPELLDVAAPEPVAAAAPSPGLGSVPAGAADRH